MIPSPESARSALLVRARAEPEQPFLFFRSPRGTFTWWSFERAAQALAAPVVPVDAPAAPRELLDAVRDAGEGELRAARELAAMVARDGEREIWISARALERLEERRLALAGTLAGWAIVREPPVPDSTGLTPALLLWARPTLLSGSEAELVALFRAVETEAPRWRRARWLVRRLDRLRIVLVEAGGSPDSVARALTATGAGLAPGPRVLSFPGSGW